MVVELVLLRVASFIMLLLYHMTSHIPEFNYSLFNTLCDVRVGVAVRQHTVGVNFRISGTIQHNPLWSSSYTCFSSSDALNFPFIENEALKLLIFWYYLKVYLSL